MAHILLRRLRKIYKQLGSLLKFAMAHVGHVAIGLDSKAYMFLFRGDAMLAVHSNEQLHRLMENFSKNKSSSLIMSHKTSMVGQSVDQTLVIKVNSYNLEEFHEFT